jgi:hypothetical protein
MSDLRRELLRQTLRSTFEQTLDERIDRYLSVNHQWLTGEHHFADASSEAIYLYRDGYYTSCIMVTQSVAEAIVRFIAERNGVPQQQGDTKQSLAHRMQLSNIVSQDLLDAFVRIQCSFRNDFHHMNPTVATVDLAPVAERNITDLATIEREIFECNCGPDGTVIPKNPLYWDISDDGTVPGYVRLA